MFLMIFVALFKKCLSGPKWSKKQLIFKIWLKNILHQVYIKFWMWQKVTLCIKFRIWLKTKFYIKFWMWPKTTHCIKKRMWLNATFYIKFVYWTKPDILHHFFNVIKNDALYQGIWLNATFYAKVSMWPKTTLCIKLRMWLNATFYIILSMWPKMTLCIKRYD